jgi:hypothetical protein
MRYSVPGVVLACVLAVGAAAEDSRAYEGWVWRTSVQDASAELAETLCTGAFTFALAGDLTWTLGYPGEACTSRTTSGGIQTVVDGASVGGTDLDEQSTQPLVPAGGNLYELYGERLDDGAGGPENRLGTLQLSPATGDLAILAAHESVDKPVGLDFSHQINVAVKSTPAVTWSGPDLEGTTWHFGPAEGSVLFMSLDLASSGATTIQFHADGVCEYLQPSAFPEAPASGFSRLVLSQWSSGTWGSRRVSSGPGTGSNVSSCSYEIDSGRYLVVSIDSAPSDASQPPIRRSTYYSLSDNLQYLIPAPFTAAAGPFTARSLLVGFQGAEAMEPDALDGDYLFYLVRNAQRDYTPGYIRGDPFKQRSYSYGQGILRFDAATPGDTPDGETGEWHGCVASLSQSSVAFGYVGEWGSVIPGSSTHGALRKAESCSFQLDPDGAMRVHVARMPDHDAEPVDVVLRGFTNKDGELVSLVGTVDDPVEPRNLLTSRTTTGLFHVLAMRYTGMPEQDQDGDELTNLAELQYPPQHRATPFRCAEGEFPIVCAVPDINGNGTVDVVVVHQEPISAEVRDGGDGALLHNLPFLRDAYTPAAVEVLPDVNDDGVPELAVLAARDSDSRVVVQIRELDGSGSPRQIWFATGFTPLRMALLDGDVDQGYAPDLAVLSTRNQDGRGVVQLKDSFVRSTAARQWVPPGFVPTDVEALPDADDNGIPEVAVLSTRVADGRVLVQVGDFGWSTVPRAIWFARGQTAIDLAVVPDKDADGIPELAVLSSRVNDGKLLAELRNAAGLLPNSKQIWFASGLTGLAIEALAPPVGETAPEIAVLSQRASDGQTVVSMRRVSGPQVPRSIGYSFGYSPRQLSVLADLDDDGVEEAAVLMVRDSDGGIVVQRRNTSDAPAPKDYVFSP